MRSVGDDLDQPKKREWMFAYKFCGRQRELVRAPALADGLPKCGELLGIRGANSRFESRNEFEPVSLQHALYDERFGFGGDFGGGLIAISSAIAASTTLVSAFPSDHSLSDAIAFSKASSRVIERFSAVPMSPKTMRPVATKRRGRLEEPPARSLLRQAWSVWSCVKNSQADKPLSNSHARRALCRSEDKQRVNRQSAISEADATEMRASGLADGPPARSFPSKRGPREDHN